MKGTWKTDSSGGGAAAVLVVLVIVGVLAAEVARPVIAGVTELVHVLLIASAVLAGVGLAGAIGLLAWRVRRSQPNAAPPKVLHPPAPQRAVQARTASQIAPPQQQVHLHFHGVDAAEVAEIIASQQHSPRED